MKQYDDLIRQPGLNRIELARLLWPNSTDASRRVMIGLWIKNGIKTITLQQIQVLNDYFQRK